MDDERRPDADAPTDDSAEPEAVPPVDSAPALDGAAPEPPAAPEPEPEEAIAGPTTPDDPSAPDAAAAPPPLVDWNAPTTPSSGWEAAMAGASTSRIDVGSLFGRTIDTFLTGWRTFVILGVPAAVLGLISQVLLYDFRSMSNIAIGTAISLLAIPVYLIVSLAMIVAADDIRAGRPASVGSAFRRGLSRTAVAFVSAILYVLIYFGLALVVVVGLALLVAVLGGSLGGILALVLGIAGFAAVIYVLLRLSMFVAPIALDHAGPMEGLRISASVVKGNLWRLGILFVAVYLLVFPLAVGAAFLILATTPLIGAVVAILAFLVTLPLFFIVLSLSYGDLTGRPRAEEQVRSPHRRLFAAAVLVGGIVLLVPSVALAVPRLGELALAAIPPEDRGTLYFGTQRNPVNPCAPLDRATTFSTSDLIYIGGYFSRSLLPGQTASIHVYIDDTEVVTSPIHAGAQAVACYYEPTPLEGAPAGEYRIIIDDSAGIFAEGTFKVQ